MQVGETVVYCSRPKSWSPVERGETGTVVQITDKAFIRVAFEVPAGRSFGSDLSGFRTTEAPRTETLDLHPYEVAYPNEYTGICPSSAGMASNEIVVHADSLDEAMALIRDQLIGSRYIARVLDASGRTVWDEHNAPSRERP